MKQCFINIRNISCTLRRAHRTIDLVLTSSLLLSLALGLTTGLSLIVAIGSQNAYLLRLGVTSSRRVMLPAVTVCALSDAVLISAGVLGVGALIESAPTVMFVVRMAGAAFLVGYGLFALRRVVHPAALSDDGQPPAAKSLLSVLLTVLAFTWLNPHVYIDSVVLLGTLAHQQTHPLWWAAGAILASFVWFAALGFGARALRPLLARPRAWQVLDAGIAVIMFALAARLLISA